MDQKAKAKVGSAPTSGSGAAPVEPPQVCARLLEGMPLPVAVLSSASKVLRLNTPFIRLFGYNLEHLADLGSWLKQAHPDPVYREAMEAFWRKLLATVRSGQATAPQEVRVRCLEGSLRVVEVSAVGVGEDVLVFFHDLTAEWLLAEKSRQDRLRNDLVIELLQQRLESLLPFLDRALEAILKLTQSTVGYIYHYSEETRLFTLHAWSKSAMDQCAIPSPPKTYELDKTGLWGEAVRQRRPILVNDFDAPHPDKRGYPKGHVHLTRFLTVPVFSGGRIVAVAGVGNRRSPYAEADAEQLVLFMSVVWKVWERVVPTETTPS